MSTQEIIDFAKGLPRVEQIRIAEALAETEHEKKQTALVKMFEGVTEIPMWSPIEAYETAEAMMRLREEARKNQ